MDLTVFPALIAEPGVQRERCRDERDTRGRDEEEAGADRGAAGGGGDGARAREQGLSLTGPDGLLKQLTKAVLERALTELTEHLGYEKHGAGSRGRQRAQRLPAQDRLRGTGPVSSRCRGTGRTFEPLIVKGRAADRGR